MIDNAEMNNVVYLFKCADSTVTVKGKINSITLDSCKKTSVVFDSVVAAMEFINCQSVQMQVCFLLVFIFFSAVHCVFKGIWKGSYDLRGQN